MYVKHPQKRVEDIFAMNRTTRAIPADYNINDLQNKT